MKRIIRLTESDLKRIVRRVIREEESIVDPCQDKVDALSKLVGDRKMPASCMASDMEAECVKDLMKMITQSTDPMVMAAAKALLKCKKDNSGMMF
jgi:hypothetical protein